MLHIYTEGERRKRDNDHSEFMILARLGTVLFSYRAVLATGTTTLLLCGLILNMLRWTGCFTVFLANLVHNCSLLSTNGSRLSNVRLQRYSVVASLPSIMMAQALCTFSILWLTFLVIEKCHFVPGTP